ncbi:MFS transporter [Nonomuraea turkmeniaca]|uniref:MFS transporter n=1 Tax=Nonomuraea turkmeniaca TaxID=103838 RepID=A0A5S4FUF8_9ACTN|nr:MFS transporter [Nonomuraea turkmeniaca]TMR24407.1 MFS transporter [Nonomuraea turkmeniaca]
MNPRQKGRSGTGSRDTAQAGRPGLRGLRAAVFAVVCVYAALGMHMLAGGPGAGLGTVAAATAATGAGAFFLARRRRSMGTLVVASFTAQYGMHQLFSSGATTLSDHHGGGGLQAGIGMLAAHVMVTIMCAWWLERGETALVTLLLLLACSLRSLWLTARLSTSPPPRPGPITAVASGVLAPQVLAWTMCRRGPPRTAG